MMDWQDATGNEFEFLNQTLGSIMKGSTIKMPFLHQIRPPEISIIHTYFHVRPNGRGSVWMWSSNHGFFIHGSIRPPLWWKNLDIVNEDQLSADPSYLNGIKDQIDKHWNDIIHARGQDM